MRRAIISVLGLVGFFIGSNALADTNVSGTISTNATWTFAGSPYIVTGDVSVGSASSPRPVLTIEPGVTVKFNSTKKLAIGWSGADGELQAVGTAAAPIAFTANTATPSAGYWWSIQFYGSGASSSQLTYATVSYAGLTSYNFGGIKIDTSSPTIRNTTVQNCAHSGITIQNASAPLIADTTLASNPTGLYIAYPATASLQTVTLSSNTGYAISLDARTTLGTVSSLTATGNGSNAIDARSTSSDVNLNTTWKNIGLPYIVTGDLNVGKASTPYPVLTIEPGVTVKFNSAKALKLGWSGAGGSVQAVGTSSAPAAHNSPTRP